MDTLNVEIKNAGAILAGLQTTIQSFSVAGNVYLTRLQGDAPAGVELNMLGIREAPLPDILALMGIRSITLNVAHDLGPLLALPLHLEELQHEQQQWHYLRNEIVLKELRSLFQNCTTIAFDDWSNMAGASDLWDGLLTDVIKPLGRKDLEFIFYMGDPGKKRSFQVDEMLDIMSDFSLHGNVTFALDESEAIKLWGVLNGVQADMPVAGQTISDLEKKYFSIFKTMNITRLLIYTADSVILFADHQHFVLARKVVDHHIEIAADARQHFIAGFSIGLLLRLDLAHTIALGLIAFGIYGTIKTTPAQSDVDAYITAWMQDLEGENPAGKK